MKHRLLLTFCPKTHIIIHKIKCDTCSVAEPVGNTTDCPALISLVVKPKHWCSSCNGIGVTEYVILSN